MTDAPERIVWDMENLIAVPLFDGFTPDEVFEGGIAYIRADVAEASVAELTAKLAEAERALAKIRDAG